MPERLVNTLRQHRTRLGMTQEELAQAVCVSRQTINSIETGRYVPSTVLALRVAAALAMPVEQLFGLPEDDPMLTHRRA